ncbi:MAG: extracellular solute-binding protein [Clostridia bacterium]|nr:extracellular solute-binding protein [Clostridia bacterium]
MKKLLTTLLAIAMVMMLCVAGIAEGAPAYIAENAAELTGEIKFYTAFAGENGTDAMIAEFNKYYPNVKVNFEVYKNSADGNVGLDTAIIAGDQVDVLLSFGVADTANRWKNGLLMDLTDRLAADGLDLVKEWGTDAYKYEDKVYVFPSGGLSMYVAINLDKWNAAGLGELPTSWTWDEYLAICEKLTEKDADGKVVVHGGSDFNQIDSWTYAVRQAKGKNVFYNAEGMCDFDNPLFLQALQHEVDSAASGTWYSKAVYQSDSTRSRNMFLNGTNATTIESILTRYIVAGKPTHKIAYAPYPIYEAGQTNYMGGSIPNSFVAVTSNTKNPEAAYAFAKFAATYGNKYMYAAGHATTWTGVDPNEVLSVVFGSEEEAAKWVDTETFTKCVIAAGEPAYSEDYIVAYSELQALVDEYTMYVVNGEMSAEDALAEMKLLGDEAIEDAK